ncbi:hypothetical protein [Campylobacter sp. MIT 12-5580]|uniref:hypothetical protein n=1 Tax=Campylobacter sp. MIT 12-5580 TaxID=2040651 RepID=UPI0014851A7B|nr:hypothetical protein [Campylobacter sp. MIT 12-5580]
MILEVCAGLLDTDLEYKIKPTLKFQEQAQKKELELKKEEAQEEKSENLLDIKA